MPERYHSREFKLQVCKQVASGERRPAQICREHNIANSLLVRWRHEYEARGEAACTPAWATYRLPSLGLLYYQRDYRTVENVI